MFNALTSIYKLLEYAASVPFLRLSKGADEARGIQYSTLRYQWHGMRKFIMKMRGIVLNWGEWNKSQDTSETKSSLVFYPFPLGWLIKKRGISSLLPKEKIHSIYSFLN